MSRLEYVFLALAILAVIAAVCAVFYYRRRTEKILRSASDMLDRAIAGGFSESVYDESLLSSVEAKLSRFLSACAVSSKNLAEEKDRIKSLIADISHQTKTPVSNILLYAQLLNEQELPADADQYAAALSGQAQKLSFLIEALVKASRLEAGIITPAPRLAALGPVLDDVAAQIAPRAKAKNISVNVAPTDEKAFFDPKWTAEALYNMVDNAVKYTSEGGSVGISATAFELFCRVDIADSGMGIAEDEQPKIFTRFYRSLAATDVEGVGIGLYLSREIVSGEGGYIRVSSMPGKGSVFSVFLPREG